MSIDTLQPLKKSIYLSMQMPHTQLASQLNLDVYTPSNFEIRHDVTLGMIQVTSSLVVTLHLRRLRSTDCAGVDQRYYAQRGDTLAPYTQNKR